ncbi:hypothetical protein EsH8_VII_000557 [Colletotrichum jinshuiense]
MKHSLALGYMLPIAAIFSHLAGAIPLQDRWHNSTWTVGQAIETSSGRIIGHAASNATEVSEYLGIPFAQPPVGSLRFQPPVQYKGTSIINAAAFGLACTQASAGIGNGGAPQGEDCLTLNIWTKPQTGERKKAILVWVYGGAYANGSSREAGYDGQFFADQTDVVLISINYRINIFGFPGNPATASNLGLLDMRLALEWIRDNADAFGGDVNRITIFGQSAGAGMTDFYSYAYASDPIASGFVLMSATVNGFPALSNSTTNPKWFSIAERAGCGSNTTDAEAISACMVSKTAEEIVAAFGSDDPGVGGGQAFGPVADDVIVFADYSNRRSAEGGYLIGNTHNEAGLFRQFQNQSDQYWDDFNTRLYTCADADRIAQSIANGFPSWRYRYFGDFPNLALSTNPPSGAYHTADLYPLFDTVPQSLMPSTPNEVAVGDYMRGAWAAFAKDVKKGLLTYADGWPLYNATEETLIRTGYDNQPGSNLALGNAYDSRCPYL